MNFFHWCLYNIHLQHSIRCDSNCLQNLHHAMRCNLNCLTHWGRVTHICVSKLTIIGSDNGLAPGRRQAIIWTNDGILLIGPLGTNFNEILIVYQTFSFKKMHLKMSSAKWRPFCLGLNVLINTLIMLRDVIRIVYTTCALIIPRDVNWIVYTIYTLMSWDVIQISELINALMVEVMLL